MRRVCAVAVSLCLLSGCSAHIWEPYRRQMDDISLLRVVGVDAGDAGVELTAAADPVGEAVGEVLTAQGETLAGAMYATRRQADRYVFYGHVDRLLLGQEQATRGIGPILDCLARDPELGPDCRLWVVRGRAAHVVNGEKGLSRRLEQMERDMDVPGAGDAMGVLAREGSMWLPALDVVEGNGQTQLQPAGYAVLRNGLLVGYTDSEGSGGLELFTGGAQGKVVELTVPEVGAVGLTLGQVRLKCQPRFAGGRLTGLDVVCEITARVAQTPVPLDEGDLAWLVYELEWQQGRCLARVLEQAQYWDADFVGLEHRARWGECARSAEISRQWSEVFRDLDIHVSVRGKVERPLA